MEDGAQQRMVSVFRYGRRKATISSRVFVPRALAAGDSSKSMSCAREAMEVSGRRCERRVSWADVRRSHSRAIAVARWGLEEGIARAFLVLGLRTGRASR